MNFYVIQVVAFQSGECTEETMTMKIELETVGTWIFMWSWGWTTCFTPSYHSWCRYHTSRRRFCSFQQVPKFACATFDIPSPGEGLAPRKAMVS